MVFIGLLSWNATALQYLKGKNASFHLQVDTSLQSNGQIAGTNVGTGIYFNILFMIVDVKDHKRKFLFGKFVCLIYLTDLISGMCHMIGLTSRNLIRIG